MSTYKNECRGGSAWRTFLGAVVMVAALGYAGLSWYREDRTFDTYSYSTLEDQSATYLVLKRGPNNIATLIVDWAAPAKAGWTIESTRIGNEDYLVWNGMTLELEFTTPTEVVKHVRFEIERDDKSFLSINNTQINTNHGGTIHLILNSAGYLDDVEQSHEASSVGEVSPEVIRAALVMRRSGIDSPAKLWTPPGSSDASEPTAPNEPKDEPAEPQESPAQPTE